MKHVAPGSQTCRQNLVPTATRSRAANARIITAATLMLTIHVMRCAAAPETNATPAAAASASQTGLEDFAHLEKLFARMSAAHRHRYSSQILQAAMLADGTDDTTAETVRQKLFESGTRADKAFGYLRELLRGDLRHALDLPPLLPEANWRVMSQELLRADRRSATSNRYALASVACDAIALCSPDVPLPTASISLKAIEKAPAQANAAILDFLRNEVRAGKRDGLAERLRATLAYAFRIGIMYDSSWSRFLSELTTDAEAELALLQAARYAGHKDVAADMAIRGATEFPANGPIAIMAFDILVRADRDEDACRVILKAEEAVPYPERRDVRLHYFRTLRATPARFAKSAPSGIVMSLDQERVEREYAAAWHDDLEARLALGDLYASEHNADQARDIYRGLFRDAADPAMRWTAWVGWAEIDADGAWRQRRALDAIVHPAATNAPVDVAIALPTCCAVALAAGGIGEALSWARDRLAHAHTAAASNTLLPTVAAMAWIEDSAPDAIKLLSPRTEASKVSAVSTVVGLPKGRIAPSGVLSAMLVQAVAQRLGDTLEREEVAVRGARLGVELVPTYTSAEGVFATWQDVALAMPVRPDPPALLALNRLTDACLAWIDDRRDDNAALRALLQSAALYIYRLDERRAEPNATRLFLACLERAAARGISDASVRTPVTYFTRGLKRAKFSAATIAADTNTIARLYPNIAADGED